MKSTLITIQLVLILIVNMSFTNTKEHTPSKKSIYDKISKQICKCVEKNNVNNIEGATPCLVEALEANKSKILEHHNVKTKEEIDGKAVGELIMKKLFRECVYFQDLLLNEISTDE